MYVRSGSGSTATWSEQQELLAGDGANFDRFGYAVALDGATALIGAPGHASAYVFVNG